MPFRRTRIHVYILLLAVILAAIAGYYLPEKRPHNASLQSHKAYIELVQKRRAERLEQLSSSTATRP